MRKLITAFLSIRALAKHPAKGYSTKPVTKDNPS
jgi:hypothetical protein